MLMPLQAISNTREAILKGHQPVTGCPSVRQLPSCAVATGLFILASHVRCEHLGQSSPFGFMSDVVCVISYFTRRPPGWDSPKTQIEYHRLQTPPDLIKITKSAPSEIQFLTLRNCHSSPHRHEVHWAPKPSKNRPQTFQNADTLNIFKKQ